MGLSEDTRDRLEWEAFVIERESAVWQQINERWDREDEASKQKRANGVPVCESPVASKRRRDSDDQIRHND